MSPAETPREGPVWELELGSPGTSALTPGSDLSTQLPGLFPGQGLMSPINSVGTGHPLRARLCAGAQNAWKKETQSRPRGLSRDRQDIS